MGESRVAGDAFDRVAARVARHRRAAVAASGGVDSTTLAAIAHAVLGERATVYHATSPAVPGEASERLRRLAAERGWRLEIIEAGEFADRRYLANPADRCFFCKSNLYDAIAAATDAAVLSGTNADDLGDWRPGLRAAAERGVRHPYVEAGVDKAGVRAIARELDLGDVAELPASPCLSSRVETGIAIEAGTLAAVHDVERLVGAALAPRTVRCRVRRARIAVELDAESLAGLDARRREALAERVAARFARAGVERAVTFEAYRMGSAFLRGAPDA